MRESDASAVLLDWYDSHARVMPWRVGPVARKAGVRPDPYHIWLSEVMLQQTTVAAVKDYFRRFVARWPRVTDLAAAADGEVMAEWAGLGYYARARNLLACARAVVADHDGAFPDTRDALLRLPGIGPYTAAAVASIAFDRAETVLDGNVERVMARRYAVLTPLPDAKPELMELAATLTPDQRPGDYAQAVMDLGATICTPRNPVCALCPWRLGCKAADQGIAADLPAKRAKPVKPTRQGIVWIARQGEGWLVERRPDKGLLGGMLGFPGDDWDRGGLDVPPITARWKVVGEVRHTFTHFHLVLAVHMAEIAQDQTPQRGQFLRPPALHPDDLPTVMKKAYQLAAAQD